MDIRIGQNFTIEQKQQLAMTPALVQAIQILQYNSQELEDFVREQLVSNPVLERNESGTSGPMTENAYEQYTAAEDSLAEHLLFQLEISAKTKNQEDIGRYIIDSIDDNGYVTMPVDKIALAVGAGKEEVVQVLHLIQTFDPYGVGARNVAECLMIQLRQAGLWNETYKKLLKDHMDDLSANRLKAISRSLEIPVHQIQQMVDILKKLDPKPGLQFSSLRDNEYITPDIYVEEQGGKYIVRQNDDSCPSLIISSYYQEMLRESQTDPEVYKYLKERINSATWLINSIRQRKQTIYDIASAVVEHQQDFFRYGGRNIKTLTLRQIAEKAQVHESTVSRTVNGKYLQCKAGVFELKYFFTSGDAEGTSSRSIKTYISDIIHGEDPHHPYSDQKISEMLKNQGIDISRRTVAKYREEIAIPASSKRKRY